MGRHGDGTVVRPWWFKPLVIFFLGAVLFGVGSVIVSRLVAEPAGDHGPEQSAPTAMEAEPGPTRSCSVVTRMTVAAAPAVSEVVSQAARSAGPGACAEFDVVSQTSAETVKEFADGRGPDVWIPESSSWVDQVEVGHPGLLTKGTSIATSPIVLAHGAGMSSPRAATWADLAIGGSMQVTDLSIEMADRLALAAAADAFGHDAHGRGRFNVALVELNRKAAESKAAQLEALSQDPAAPAFPIDEATLSRFASENPGLKVMAFMPSRGTPRFDYPLVRRSADVKHTEEGTQALVAALAGGDGQAAIHAAGLRTSVEDDTAPPAIAAARPTYLTPSGVDVINRTMTAWLRAGTDARQLVVIDVSGSMKAKAGATTRIDLVADAARQALTTYPDSSEMGLWVFSQWRGPNREDHLALAPVLPLDARSGDTTHRAELEARLDSLSGIPRGGTGLYDTMLAAYEEVQKGWDPKRTNALVLLTDGRNEDEKGLTLPQLIDTLTKLRDPAKPISVALVGIGPDADGKVLRQIAAAVGGRPYYASDPAVIQSVFIDALLSRPRPGD